MAYGALGLDLLQTLKTALGAGKQAAQDVLLSKAGTAIARSPQGQAAIKQSLVAQGKEAAVSVLDTVRPFLIPALVLGGLYYVTRNRGRR